MKFKNIFLTIVSIVLFMISLNLNAQVLYTKTDTFQLEKDSVILKVNDFRGDIQWQFSKDMQSWNDVESGIADSLFIQSIDSSGFYRAKVSDGYCEPVFSDTAKIKYELPISIVDTVTAITDTSAIIYGTILSNGGATISSMGICWSSSETPTIEDSIVYSNSDSIKINCNISGLTSNNTYYIRTFVTNELGTSYSNQLSFTTTFPPISTEKEVSVILNLDENVGEIIIIDEIGRVLEPDEGGEFIAEENTVVMAVNADDGHIVYISYVRKDTSSDTKSESLANTNCEMEFNNSLNARSTAQYVLSEATYPMITQTFNISFDEYMESGVADLTLCYLGEEIIDNATQSVQSNIDQNGSALLTKVGDFNLGLIKGIVEGAVSKYTGGMFTDCFSKIVDLIAGKSLNLDVTQFDLEQSLETYNQSDVTKPHIVNIFTRFNTSGIIITDAIKKDDDRWDITFNAYNALPHALGIVKGKPSTSNSNVAELVDNSKKYYLSASPNWVISLFKNGYTCDGFANNLIDNINAFRTEGAGISNSDFHVLKNVKYEMSPEEHFLILTKPEDDKEVWVYNFVQKAAGVLSNVFDGKDGGEAVGDFANYVLEDERVNQIINSENRNELMTNLVQELLIGYLETVGKKGMKKAAEELVGYKEPPLKKVYDVSVKMAEILWSFISEDESFSGYVPSQKLYIPNDDDLTTLINAPANNAIIQGNIVELQWEAPRYYSDNDLRYDIYLGTEVSGSEYLNDVVAEDLTETNFEVENLLPNQTYHWIVRTKFYRKNEGIPYYLTLTDLHSFQTSDSAPEPTVADVIPKTATLGQETTFTVTGANLESDIFFDIENLVNKTFVSLNSSKTEFKFKGIPGNSAGTKNGVIKDAPEGNILKEFQVNFIEEQTRPTVTTDTPTEKTETSVKLNGNVTSNGGAEVTSRGFYWSETDATPDSNDNVEPFEKGTGEFSITITGLTPNTKYYVRTYAENSIGEEFGKVLNFTTLEDTQISITSVTPTEATLGVETTFTVTGSNLNDNLAYHLDDLESLTKIAGGTSTQQQFKGMPSNFAGQKNGVIKDAPDGNQLHTFLVAFIQAQTKPTVTTASITNKTQTTATCGGNVTSDGGAAVTAHGICWNTTGNPTTSDFKTIDGSGVGVFTSNLTELTENTTYYVRAYAINSIDTEYGEVVSFITESSESDIVYGSITDTRDGRVYKTVKIGEQWWMAENLKAIKYYNGNSIPIVTDNAAWANLEDSNQEKAYCYQNNNMNGEADKYGVLYTWAAAMNGEDQSKNNPSNVQGVCPSGSHIPSDSEWIQLDNFLNQNGYSENEGTALKSKTDWEDLGTDTYGFNGLPGGSRLDNGTFYRMGRASPWWSSSENYSHQGWVFGIYYGYSDIRGYYYSKSHGYYVRCVKD